MKKIGIILFLSILLSSIFAQTLTYPIVDTDVQDFYSDAAVITAPALGAPYYGQDATYTRNQPSYTDNGDGTITDNVTGLVWQKDMGTKESYADALVIADTMTLGGYTDWRVPSIKELYSLILFSGQVKGTTAISMFIDIDYFIQPLGDVSNGEREIDAQTWSSTQYVGLTMRADTTIFGVNFVDGRIKGYPKYQPPLGTVANKMYFRMVRGNTSYAINDFVDNNDGTVSDRATGLMWQKADDGIMRDWEAALTYAESLSLAGHNDWRLPNAKELQSIVDYTRSPQTSNSPVIAPLFFVTEITDPDGASGQYPYFWTGTTHLDGANPYSGAVYIAFGEAQGKMNNKLMDVHGAGAQRSDPKSGSPSDYPDFHGPQGDVRYVYNAVRCVRDLSSTSSLRENKLPDFRIYPNPAQNQLTIKSDMSLNEVKVYNLLGEELILFSPQQKELTLNTEKFPNGVYFIKMTLENGVTATESFIIAN